MGFGLDRLAEADEPAAWAVAAAAAAADDFDAERDEGCFCTPPALDTDGLRRVGATPGGNGFFLGGAIFKSKATVFD